MIDYWKHAPTGAVGAVRPRRRAEQESVQRRHVVQALGMATGRFPPQRHRQLQDHYRNLQACAPKCPCISRVRRPQVPVDAPPSARGKPGTFHRVTNRNGSEPGQSASGYGRCAVRKFETTLVSHDARTTVLSMHDGERVQKLLTKLPDPAIAGTELLA